MSENAESVNQAANSQSLTDPVGEQVASKPLLSVVTVVRNAREPLLATIRSVHEQQLDLGQIEHVIVDGASTDGTAAVARTHLRPHDRLVSEPDDGIYDAMNKGLRLARGTWLLFMNAGDVFASPETLALVADHMSETNDLLLGETLTSFIDDLGKRHFHSKPSERNDWWKGMPACHQSIFYRTSLLKDFPFDTRYTWCADFEQFARILCGQPRITTLSSVVAHYDGNGADGRNQWIYIGERFRASRPLAPRWRRFYFYGSESVRHAILGPIVGLIRRAMPAKWLLKLRRIRGTSGVSTTPHE